MTTLGILFSVRRWRPDWTRPSGASRKKFFTRFVPAEHVGAVGGEKFLESLAGNPVTVTGKIELYKGRPEIVISLAAQ